jgi:hypothetical protein
VFFAGPPASFDGSKRSSGDDDDAGDGVGDGVCAATRGGRLPQAREKRRSAHTRGDRNFSMNSDS